MTDVVSYKTIGTLVALAPFHGVALPVRFAIALYRKLLNRPVGFGDLKEIDPTLRLKQLLKMKNGGDDVATCDVRWAVITEEFGVKKLNDLCARGSEVVVTNENLDAYVKRYIGWKLNERVSAPFRWFADGFRLILPVQETAIFAPDELDLVVSGVMQYDWGSLRKVVKYHPEHARASRAIHYFWEIFDRMTQEDKLKWLMFTVGTDSVPVNGFRSLELSIKLIDDLDRLPTAHTCMSEFVLPDYPTKELMEDKILLAVRDCEGFAFN
jgi:ubiquitin-protein ligase E3 A